MNVSIYIHVQCSWIYITIYRRLGNITSDNIESYFCRCLISYLGLCAGCDGSDCEE